MKSNCDKTLLKEILVGMCFLIYVESLIIKPVVPNFCLRLCNETVGCRCFVYLAWDLSCHLLTNKSAQQVYKDTESICAVRKMACPQDLKMKDLYKDGALRLKQFSMISYNEEKNKGKCSSSRICNVPAEGKMKNEKLCVLYRRENIKIRSKTLIKLPLTVRPGMKVTVYGGYIDGLEDTQLTFTRQPNKSHNFLEWVHIRPDWKRKGIALSSALWPPKYYKGAFPISDPTHFTLAVELTSNITKIYVNKVAVFSVELISEIKDFFLRRWNKVYLLTVQKTGEGCEEMDVDIS